MVSTTVHTDGPAASVAGEKTYVMILTQGPPADLEKLREEIERMAESLRLP